MSIPTPIKTKTRDVKEMENDFDKLLFIHLFLNYMDVIGCAPRYDEDDDDVFCSEKLRN